MTRSTARNRCGRSGRPTVPKVLGADVELGNFILGVERSTGTGSLASAAILREVKGVSRRPATGNTGVGGVSPAQSATQYTSQSACWTGYGANGFNAWNGYSHLQAEDPQDRDRKWLATNGGCIYIDLDHVEFAIPEVRSAREFVAASHGMLRIVRNAVAAASAKRPPGEKIVALANNSDGRGNSYGSHLNLLLSRQAWDELFARRLFPTLFNFIAYQTSSIVFTGQGKVGAENGRPWAEFQISQRADFFETQVGAQTTFHRPLANSRDEPLCGPASAAGTGPFARLHCIFYDHTLCHTSTFLKAGVMQIIGAQIEAGDLDQSLIIDDPLSAVLAWSRDPDLTARARLIDGRQVTATELQLMFLERAAAFVHRGGCRGIVPEAGSILALWEKTLCKLQARDFDALMGIDWVLKRSLIERARPGRPELDWSSPDIRFLDFSYSNLDEREGLYWACERSGLTQPFVTDTEIERFVTGPPENTRAWARAMILRSLRAETITDIDWDRITMRLPMGGIEHGESTCTLRFDTPLGWTRKDAQCAFRDSASIADLVLNLKVLESGSTSDAAVRETAHAGAATQSHSAKPPPGAEESPTIKIEVKDERARS